MVAAIILALVMNGFVYVFVAGRKHILHSRSRIQAAQLERLFLNYLQMHVRQNDWEQATNALSVTPLGGRDCANQPGCPVNERALDGITYNPQYYISGVGTTNLRRVKVDITWNEPAS